MNLCDESTIRALLERHGFHFSKSMGQNFLIDPEVPARIAASSEADRFCGVLEIGPGIGPLTVKLDLNALIAEEFQGLRPIVCANLPYNITTPVLTKFVETPAIETITVLIQKEVAQRLAAPQGSSDGGAFSLYLQYYMETSYLFDVPREKFLPSPKVTSAVLRCVRREKPAVEVADEAFFFKVIKGAFLLRRKTLVNSLAAALPGTDKTAIADAIAACGLPPAVRGEALTLADFAALSSALAKAQKS